MQRQRQKRQTQTFLQGAIILASATVLVKVIGAIFKIPLSNLIGGEGMGYFTTAYGLFNPIYGLAIAGFPVAVSKLVAQSVASSRYKQARTVFSVARVFLMIAGVIGFVIMLAGSELFAVFSGNIGAKWAIWAISPTILFTCMMAAYRGYYEGMRNMIPTAASQVIEAVAKLVFGLGLSFLTMYFGHKSYLKTGKIFGVLQAVDSAQANQLLLQLAAAAAIAGVMLSTFVGMIYLMIRFWVKGDGVTANQLAGSPAPQAKREIVRQLISIAIPVCLGSLVLNLTSVIDLFSVMNRLQAAIARDPQQMLALYQGMIPQNLAQDGIPNYLWGCYQGLAVTIFNLVPSITVTFGISALPAVTTAWTRKNKAQIRSGIESVLRITCLVAFPAGLSLSVLAKPILSFLFGQRPQEVLVAAPLLQIMGIAAIFVAIASPVYSMLQAIGRADLPVKFMAVGALIKLAANFMLVGVGSIGIQGAPIGTLLCYVFILAASIGALSKHSTVKISKRKVFVKPLFCGIMCAASAWASNGLLLRVGLNSKFATLLCIGIGCFTYLIFLFLTKTLAKEDVFMLPKGEKIVKTLEKYHLIG